MLIVTTKELQKKNYIIENSLALDISNIKEIIKTLQIEYKKTKSITLYDRTKNKTLKQNAIIKINDHINKTGINPLIGKQRELKIDFIDMTNVYTQSKQGVVTESFGEKLQCNTTYPSHYIAPLTIIAKAIGFKKIKGFLINKI